MDDLAWLWTAGVLAAFIGILLWALATTEKRQREARIFSADPLMYAIMFTSIALILGFLAWIATRGRLFGLWTLPAAFVSATLGCVYDRRKRKRK